MHRLRNPSGVASMLLGRLLQASAFLWVWFAAQRWGAADYTASIAWGCAMSASFYVGAALYRLGLRLLTPHVDRRTSPPQTWATPRVAMEQPSVLLLRPFVMDSVVIHRPLTWKALGSPMGPAYDEAMLGTSMERLWQPAFGGRAPVLAEEPERA